MIAKVHQAHENYRKAKLNIDIHQKDLKGSLTLKSNITCLYCYDDR